jgi:hypothetical protein
MHSSLWQPSADIRAACILADAVLAQCGAQSADRFLGMGGKDEFGWGETTARKYMLVADSFKSALGVDFTGLTIDATAL